MRAVIALVAGGGAVCTAFGAPVGPPTSQQGPIAHRGDAHWTVSTDAAGQNGFNVPGQNIRTVTITLSDWLSDRELGGAGNTTAAIDLNALLGSTPGGALAVTGIAWNLNIETFGSSPLSDATLQIHDAALPGTGLSMTPGSSSLGGGASFGSLTAVQGQFARIVLSGGILGLEAFEKFDDVLGADAAWNGTITFAISQAAPAPTAGLAGLGGLAGLAALRRRR